MLDKASVGATYLFIFYKSQQIQMTVGSLFFRTKHESNINHKPDLLINPKKQL